MLEIGLVKLRKNKYEVQRNVLIQMTCKCQGFQHSIMRLDINQSKLIVNDIFIEKM